MSKESENKGMTLIVKTVTRLTVGLILLFGLYVVFNGHHTPGGGFAGGVIIALSFVHLMLAFGKEAAFKKFSQSVASVFLSLGAIIFITSAILGFSGGYFFLNFLSKGESFALFSGGTIPLCEIAICFVVSSGLFAVLVAIVLLKIRSGKE
ncbi:MAG: hypothetical protein JW983_03130 [Elusimicrobia bacterium]|nr:hypothetical protein [Elusimicrobiota bacterium]